LRIGKKAFEGSWWVPQAHREAGEGQRTREVLRKGFTTLGEIAGWKGGDCDSKGAGPQKLWAGHLTPTSSSNVRRTPDCLPNRGTVFLRTDTLKKRRSEKPIGASGGRGPS